MTANAPHRIDVHHHLLPPATVAARREHGIRTGPGFEHALAWTPEASLERMEEAGIAAAVLSHTSNWSAFPADLVPRLARDSNLFAARLVTDHPGRFGFFAAIPMPSVDESLAEIGFALDELGADGVSTTTNYGDRWLGEPGFDPILAELDRRSAVVFVHPQAPRVASGLTPPVPDATVEYMFDIVRAITAMLFRGVFTRFPAIRFIFTHGGGGLPALAERVERNAQLQPAVRDQLPNGATAALRGLYYDVTTSLSPPAAAALRAFLPTTQLLFGSDFPFVRPIATASALTGAGFGAAERAAIERGNAERLFPRFRGIGP